MLDVKASFVLDKGSLTEQVERISRSSGQEPIAAIGGIVMSTIVVPYFSAPSPEILVGIKASNNVDHELSGVWRRVPRFRYHRI